MKGLRQVILLLVLLWLVALTGADVGGDASAKSTREPFQGADGAITAVMKDRQEAELKANAYLVINLETGKTRFSAEPPNLDDDTCRTSELWLRRIPAGAFEMGSPENELGRDVAERQHNVTLTEDFYVGVFECTQRQWELVMGEKPAKHRGDCRPVESVSYNMIRGTETAAGAGWPTQGHEVEATSFLGRLRAKCRLDVDLPTEAQWEYACRAKTSSAFNSGQEMPSDVKESGLYEFGRFEYYRQKDGRGGYEEHTVVGSYQPNAWGLYDMHGNVWEWCLDWRGVYPEEDVTDPKGALNGKKRVIRGGAWNNKAAECRSAARGASEPQSNYYGFGFRIVCPVPQDADHAKKTTMGAYLVIDLNSWTHRFETATPNLSSDACRTTELWLRRMPSGGYVGVFEVTQAQWERVTGSNPARFKGACRPVESVSYIMVRGDAEGVGDASFLGQLRERTGLAFDLPTAAQWKEACGEDVAQKSGSREEHAVVGSLQANGLGLYDMRGNVEEWCLSNGQYRMALGGSWLSGKVLRHSYAPAYKFCDLGLRVVCTEVKPR